MGKIQIESTYRINATQCLNDHLRQLDVQIDTLLRNKASIDKSIDELMEQKRKSFERLSIILNGAKDGKPV